MRFSPTLGLYLGRRMLAGIGGAFAALAALLFAVDALELGRRAARDDDTGTADVLRMALLHLPYLAQRALPYAVLIGGLLSLSRLARRNEVAAVGAAGVSTAQILFPGVAVAVLAGALSVGALGPLASATLARYHELDNRLLRDRTAAALALPEGGLWLRQDGPGGASIVHAARIDPGGAALRGVFVLRYDADDRFVERIDAAEAEVRDDHWLLRGARIDGPGREIARRDSIRLDTAFSMTRIQDSFAAPEALSFWELPAFIASLEAAGFSALRHRLHWHAMAASPMMFAGMVLIAAAFALRMARAGSGRTLALGGACGFGFYVFSDLVAAYGLNGRIPYVLAGWAPAAVAVLAGGGLLLHRRQG